MLFVVLCRYSVVRLLWSANLDPPISENCTAYLNAFFSRTHFLWYLRLKRLRHLPVIDVSILLSIQISYPRIVTRIIRSHICSLVVRQTYDGDL
jgi:hypothetical protein